MTGLRGRSLILMIGGEYMYPGGVVGVEVGVGSGGDPSSDTYLLASRP